MVWSYISQFSINKTGHFFHLTSVKFSDMKEAHTFGLRNSLFMAFFSLQSSIERLCATAFLSKKVEILIFCFLFSFLLQDLWSLLTVKRVLSWFQLKALRNYLAKNIIEFLGSEHLYKLAIFILFVLFSVFVLLWVQISKCQNLENWIFSIKYLN